MRAVWGLYKLSGATLDIPFHGLSSLGKEVTIGGSVAASDSVTIRAVNRTEKL